MSWDDGQRAGRKREDQQREDRGPEGAHLYLIVGVMMMVASVHGAHLPCALLTSAYPRRLRSRINTVGMGFIPFVAGLDPWGEVKLVNEGARTNACLTKAQRRRDGADHAQW